MKKILLLLLPLLSMISCGNSYTYNGFTVKSYDVHVGANDWQYTDLSSNNYFYYVEDMPEISSYVFDNGEVNVYRVFKKGTREAFKHILPDVLHCEEFSGNQPIRYTTTVDCIYGPGWLEFNYRASDFAYEQNININPEAMDFTIVITTKN